AREQLAESQKSTAALEINLDETKWQLDEKTESAAQQGQRELGGDHVQETMDVEIRSPELRSQTTFEDVPRARNGRRIFEADYNKTLAQDGDENNKASNCPKEMLSGRIFDKAMRRSDYDEPESDVALDRVGLRLLLHTRRQNGLDLPVRGMLAGTVANGMMRGFNHDGSEDCERALPPGNSGGIWDPDSLREDLKPRSWCIVKVYRCHSSADGMCVLGKAMRRSVHDGAELDTCVDVILELTLDVCWVQVPRPRTGTGRHGGGQMRWNGRRDFGFESAGG
ncbi:7742_t:CDS:2, partial [Scutellospora calospora]